MHQIKEGKKNPLCFSGVVPNTDLLAGSGVEVDPRGAVLVDKVKPHATTAQTDVCRVPVGPNGPKHEVLACDTHILQRCRLIQLRFADQSLFVKSNTTESIISSCFTTSAVMSLSLLFQIFLLFSNTAVTMKLYRHLYY